MFVGVQHDWSDSVPVCCSSILLSDNSYTFAYLSMALIMCVYVMGNKCAVCALVYLGVVSFASLWCAQLMSTFQNIESECTWHAKSLDSSSVFIIDESRSQTLLIPPKTNNSSQGLRFWSGKQASWKIH